MTCGQRSLSRIGYLENRYPLADVTAQGQSVQSAIESVKRKEKIYLGNMESDYARNEMRNEKHLKNI